MTTDPSDINNNSIIQILVQVVRISTMYRFLKVQKLNISVYTKTLRWHHDGSTKYPILTNGAQQRIMHFSSSKSTYPADRRDPTAKRPTKVCDPYGLNGQPMSFEEASNQISLLDPGWSIETNNNSTDEPPLSLQKEFYHLNYTDGSKFMHKVAAVAQNNNHYPSITLERRLLKKEKAWKIVTTVKCSTIVLGGLSFHDFHIAMLVDVELSREDTKCLVIKEGNSCKKTH